MNLKGHLALGLAGLSLAASCLAGPVADGIRARPWFDALTPGQKTWLLSAVDNGFASQPPLTVRFWSLENPLTVFRSSALNDPARTFPAVATAAQDDKGWSGASELLTLNSLQGPAWQVLYRHTKGWMARSAIGTKSIAIATADGAYVRDIFPTYFAGGNPATVVLHDVGGKLYLAVRYVESFRGREEKWFGFQYDPDKNAIVDVVEWPPAAGEGVAQAPLKSVISTDALNRLSHDLGFGKSGFIRYRDGKLEEKSLFGQPFSADTPAVVVNGRVYMNALD